MRWLPCAALLCPVFWCVPTPLVAAGPAGQVPSNPQDWDGIWAPNEGISFANPPKGAKSPAPLRPEYAEREKSNLQGIKEGKPVGDPTVLCVPSGMPRQLINPYPMEIVFAPGRTIFLYEYMSQIRRIFTDGRKHPDPEEMEVTFNGHSIGHWDNDVLTVHTTGLRDDTMFQIGMPHSDKTEVEERYRLVNRNLLEAEVVITDPKALTAPWKVRRTWTRRSDWTIAEYVCEENNRDKKYGAQK